MSDVSINYKGSEIASMNASGSKVLTTQGKYCEDNITINYAKPTPVEVESKDVDFYDYDGTRLYSYTKQEFLALNEMPANPTHEGLISQGWNWTLADAKEYVTDYDFLNVGQMYITNDGKTRIYCHFTSEVLSFYLSLQQLDNGKTITIDWGDGTSESTIYGTNVYQHTYSNIGDYVIVLTLNNNGRIQLNNCLIEKSSAASKNENIPYQSVVKKIELGSNVYFGNDTFNGCTNLETITMPNYIASSINSGLFSRCYNLKHIVIPSLITTISDYAFQYCYLLRTVCIPASTTIFARGCFSDCSALERIIMPKNATTITYSMFAFCYKLSKVKLPNTITSIGASAFVSNYQLKSLEMPNTITSIGMAAVQNNYQLKSLEIPTSITSIPNAMFNSCYSLEEITIPSLVGSIGANAFSACFSLKKIYFKPTTPPTCSNSNAWANLPTDCSIYVPTGKLNDYKTATNYPDPTIYTYVEE